MPRTRSGRRCDVGSVSGSASAASKQQQTGQHDEHREHPVPGEAQQNGGAQRRRDHRGDAEHQHQPRHHRRRGGVGEQIADDRDRHHHRSGRADALQPPGDAEHDDVRARTGTAATPACAARCPPSAAADGPANPTADRSPADRWPGRPACPSASAAPPTTTPSSPRRSAATRAGTCRWSAGRGPPGGRAPRSSGSGWGPSVRRSPPASAGAALSRSTNPDAAMKVVSKGYERFLPSANGDRHHRRARGAVARSLNGHHDGIAWTCPSAQGGRTHERSFQRQEPAARYRQRRRRPERRRAGPVPDHRTRRARPSARGARPTSSGCASTIPTRHPPRSSRSWRSTTSPR